MRKNATKLAAAVLSLAMVMTSVNMPASAAKTKVKLNKTKATLYVNGSASEKATTLKVTVNGKKVNATFKSSNTKVLTVAKKTGKVTAKKNGTAKVTATYKKKKYNCTVTVKTYATSVSITSAKTLNLAAGKTATINATVKPSTASNKKVSFTSSKKNVATVTSAGKVTAKKAGTATVTVKALGSKKAAKKATVKVNVKAAVKPSTEPTTTPTTEPTATPETPVATEGAITVTTNVTGAAVKVVSGTAVVATASAIASESAIKTPKVANGTYTVVVSKDGYKETTKEVTVNGDTEVSVDLEKLAEPTSATVTAIGAKKIQVALDSPAADTSKAKITIKKGAIDVNTDKVTFADDKKTALVETSAKLTKGDYVITVSGVATKDITSKLTAEDEKVAKIDVTTKTAPYVSSTKTDTIVAKYVVSNQYGEDITKDITSGLTWTASTGTNKATPKETGTLNIANTTDGTAFIPGSKVYLTGVYAQNGVSAVVNAELTVGLEAKADQITFKGVYDTVAGKMVDLPAGFTEDSKYVLLFETKDQYGNVMPAYDKATNDLVFTSNNPLFVKVDASNAALTKITYNDIDYTALPLKHGDNTADGGKVTISVISNTTGKTASYTIDTAAASQVKTFTMSAPQTMVAEDEKVEIPFTAVDQYGKAVTNYDALNGSVTLNPTIGTLAFEAQNDGTAKLFYTAPSTGASENADAIANITSLVAKGGSFSSVMINVKVKATPKAVIGLKDVNTNVAAGNSVKIEAKNILLQDQYGRTMKEEDALKWFATSGNSVKVESTYKASDDNSAFVVVSETSDKATVNGTTPITITAKADRKDTTEKFTFKLNNGVEDISGSDKTITFTKVKQSEYKSYEVDDLGTMNIKVGQATAEGYAKEVKVYGVKEDGTKVQLPNDGNAYTIDLGKFSNKFTTAGSKISDKGSKGVVEGDFDEKLADGKASNNKTIDVNVVINDSNTGAVATTITKKLVLSKEEAKATTVLFDTDKVVDGKVTIKPKSGAIAASDLTSLVKKVKDQYGVEKAATVSKITISEVKTVADSTFKVSESTNGTATANIAGAKLGDKFKVTYTANDGVTASIDVTVGAEKTQAELDKEAADAENAAKAEADKAIADAKTKITKKITESSKDLVGAVDSIELTATEFGDCNVTVTEGEDTGDILGIDNKTIKLGGSNGTAVLAADADNDKTATFSIKIEKTNGKTETLNFTVTVAKNASTAIYTIK